MGEKQEPNPPTPFPKREGGASPSPQRGGVGEGFFVFAVAAVGLLTAFALLQALAQGTFPDFFIYRHGAELALHRESPYDLEKIRAAVAVQFPIKDDATENEKADHVSKNCGFFLPPQAILLYAPFAAVPFPVAKLLWAIVTGFAAAAVLLLFRTFGNTPPATLIGRLVPLFLLLNFLTIGVIVVGQTPLVCVGCVAAGQWCFERKWPILGALLWAIPFVKPHVALALLPLAWYLGGWKRAAAIAGIVAALNLAGCAIAGVSPTEYLDFLTATHKSVAFNLAERNYEITSWNRLLIVCGGPVIEQTAAITLASYLVWFGLVVGRVAIAGEAPSPAWAMAAAAAGAVFCPQVLGYEVLILLLAVPWVCELFAGGRRVFGWIAVVVLGIQAIPIQVLNEVGVTFHRPLGVALFAVLVLIGPFAAAKPHAAG